MTALILAAQWFLELENVNQTRLSTIFFDDFVTSYDFSKNEIFIYRNNILIDSLPPLIRLGCVHIFASSSGSEVPKSHILVGSH
jgi:hypothetical protein